MKKRYLVTAFILAGLQLCAAEQKFGIVNLENVFTETKLAKQEQNSLETMSKQFTSLLEDTEKQLRDTHEKLQDQDYLDGLSPEAQKELENKFGQLSEEMNRYKQQYYQFIQQGQQKMAQTVISGISQAAEKIAAAKGFTMVLNKQMCFYTAPSLDVTSDMIKEMDKNFDAEAKKQAAAAPEEAKKPADTKTAAKEEAKKSEAPVAAQEKAKQEEAKKPAAPKAEEKKSGKDASKSR